MIELLQFGTIIQKYTGTGQLRRKGGSPEECSFEAGQFSDGKVIVICTISKIYLDGKDGEITLVGTTVEGENFFAVGHTIQNRYSLNISDDRIAKAQVVLQSSGQFQLGVGDKDWQHHARIHFYITNLKFIGTLSEEIKPNYWSVNHVRLNLSGKELTIRQLNDYDQRIKLIEDKHETHITAEIIIEIYHDRFTEALELASSVCDLLSIARSNS